MLRFGKTTMTRTALIDAVAFALAALAVRPGTARGQATGPDRAAMRARMLKRLDTDGDSKIGPAELARARAQAATPSNYRLEVITFPKEVQDADANMDSKALLYHPVEKPEGKIPLIVVLHGAGATKHKDVSRLQWSREVKWLSNPANSKHVAKILVPHSRSHWNPAALDVALDYVLKTNKDIDEERVYCIGFSMGGLGAWNWAKHSAKRLAAIIPVAFIPDQRDLEKVLDLPIWAMAGTADRRRARAVAAMEKALKALGSTVVRTTIFEGANHYATGAKAWAQEGLLDWLFAQRRKK